MRYPLRSRTPISGMKRLGLYVPPPVVRPAVASLPPRAGSARRPRPLEPRVSATPGVSSPLARDAGGFPSLRRESPPEAFSARREPSLTVPSRRAQRAEAAKRASIASDLPAPRASGGAENDAPARVVAFSLPEPKPYASFGTKRKSLSVLREPNESSARTNVANRPEPLAVLCRDAAATRKGMVAEEREADAKPARASATRRGSRSRGGRGRGGVKVVILPKATAGPTASRAF